MPNFTILYDALQEAEWFRSLHPDLQDANMKSITTVSSQPNVAQVLSYDRPDIILLDDLERPILVVEQTVEVPSGHNAGQRFARIAAAAEAGVPSLYFCPYVAQKHGGNTAGPRYMNLRLWKAFESMIAITGLAATTINWPVDNRYEICKGSAKDVQVRAYMKMFLDGYYTKPFSDIHNHILTSPIHQDLVLERQKFSQTMIRNPEQYDKPPKSVVILSYADFIKLHENEIPTNYLDSQFLEVITYEVGMTSIRSDPYTGMSMLYQYLYIIPKSGKAALVLWFPNITFEEWNSVAVSRQTRKDIRIYRVSADAILFKNHFATRSNF